MNSPDNPNPLDRIIWFCLENKLIVVLVMVMVIVWGTLVAPFDWKIGGLPRDPVPVDAIPDIGENQQIVFTKWMGRSPQDVEDQIGYPLTVSLLGLPSVKSIRSYSMFGFSTIYVIFKDDVDYYWSRSRVLEKLNSLPAGTLPDGVAPALGPDATALGQIFWYTLEGQDEQGQSTGGWDLHELRSIQDWYVRYALQAAEGVSEVASVGGFVREYQVDVDPDAMRAHGVSLENVFTSVRMSNVDVGARSIEINRVEYFIRGLGFLKSVTDIENSVVKVNDNVPIYVKDVAKVVLGPALRRGALDKQGAEAVGGVVVVRYGENPLAAIKNVKRKIEEIKDGLPERAVIDWSLVTREEVGEFAAEQGIDAFTGISLNQDAWLKWVKQTPIKERPAWAQYSKVTVVPFYDRSGLIYETLGTLNTAIYQEILITIIVVLVMVRHFSSSVLISGLLPLAVLMTFIAMSRFGVDANIVALSGIAIAIGTMVDMAVVVCENILRRMQEAEEGESSLETIYRATTEVSGAVLTAVATTVVGFLPVFAMEAAEGKLFKPLAYTKTFALLAAIIIALTLIPAFAHILFDRKTRAGLLQKFKITNALRRSSLWIVVAAVAVLLAGDWLPLGPENGIALNAVFVGSILGGILFGIHLFQMAYVPILRWALAHKALFLCIPALLIVFGVIAWRGFGKEFMPPLDEGSYLFMPTTMPHASIGEALDVLQKQDMAIQSVPEVDSVVGKLGRADSPLDPAPISMFETIINYKPEFDVDRNGKRRRYKFDPSRNDQFRDEAGTPMPAPDGRSYTVRGRFERDDNGALLPDSRGAPFRLWRPELDPALNEGRDPWMGITRPDDIWKEILEVTVIPGTTSAPRLQPIAARIVMLQSGMRAPMGIKVKGPDLETIERVGLDLERLLKQVPSVNPKTVVADRMVGKPYLEIDIDRKAIARYGIHIQKVQQVIEVAIGGMTLTSTVEGRARFPVRVRYQRELRDSIEAMEKIFVPTSTGAQIPLTQIAEIKYLRGPQVIKSEDTFLVGYVIFDKQLSVAEVDAVEDCQRFLKEKISAGEFVVPDGVSFTFAGSYENQIRAAKKLAVVLPLALFLIFIILYLQFRSTLTALMVFSGIVVAWMGGFLMLWCYAQPWFLDVSILGTNMRDLFQIHPVNLSVAVWVGFLALFGIASDNGVIVATILNQLFGEREVRSIEEVRELVVEGAQRRIRPALMTSATTLLALLPVLSSSGRGADIMIPMAIPSFGGMAVALITVFIVPLLYGAHREWQFKRRISRSVAEVAETSERRRTSSTEP
jgi:Cu(I)/Ag(I) efflux system membrane protein CusA/SilA